MENKLVSGIIIDAIVNGAATLADRSTRNALTQSFKNIRESNRSRRPSKTTPIKGEVLYWKDTVEEIRRNNPELEKSIKGARGTSMNRKNNHLS